MSNTDKISWKEEAWEAFLVKFWDNRPRGVNAVRYTKSDLHEILKKYTKSGQGEIRIFHSGHENIKAVQKRKISKIPISRSEWLISNAVPLINFSEPKDEVTLDTEITRGMYEGVKDSLESSSNPGETTLLAIAKYVGLLNDFYSLEQKGVMFTGGKQKADTEIYIGSENISMKKAQIEIDGAYEWENAAVIVEMKSSFKQPAFDTNQALIPLLKWKNKLMQKTVYSLVLLAETKSNSIEYWAYDLVEHKKNKMSIKTSKKYVLKIDKKMYD